MSAATMLSPSYLYDVERGHRLPTLDQLDAVAQVLGVLVTDLLADIWPYGSTDKPRPPRHTALTAASPPT